MTELTEARAEELLEVAAHLFTVRDYASALDQVQAVMETFPKHPKAHHLLALIHQVTGNYEQACAYLTQSGFGPSPDVDLVHYEHFTQWQGEFERQQATAVKLRRPAMVIASLPRSASAYVSSFTSALLSMAACRTSIGAFPDFRVVPEWARRVASGGAVTHEHIGATPENLGALLGAGVQRIAVQVRDPRQQTISWLHHRLKEIPEVRPREPSPAEFAFVGMDFPDQVQWLIETHFEHVIQWVADWVEIADDPASGMDIHLCSFEAFAADKATFFRDLWGFFGVHAKAQSLANAVDSVADNRDRWTNFRQGTADEWRRVTTADQGRQMWDRIPRAMAERFGWRE